MPDGYVFQSNGRVELSNGFLKSLFGNDVVSSDVHVARVNASSHGNVISQTLRDFGNLLKAAAKRVLGAGGVFDQDCESALCQVKPVAGCRNGGGSLQQSLVSIGATK